MSQQRAPSIRIANKSSAAEFFGVSLPAIDGWVRRGCPVMERGHKTAPYQFDLRAVAEWYYGNRGQTETGETDPEKLSPKERKDWYDGEKVRRDLQIKDGQLIPASEVETEMAAIVKTFVGFLEQIPDILERDANISGDAVERLQEIVDRERERLYQQMTA